MTAAARKTLTLKKKDKPLHYAPATVKALAEELPLAPAAAATITQTMPDLWNGIRVEANQRDDGKWQAAIYYRHQLVFLAPELCKDEDSAHASAHRYIATSLSHAMAWIRALSKIAAEK